MVPSSLPFPWQDPPINHHPPPICTIQNSSCAAPCACTLCLHPVPAQRASSCPRGPPPPTPPILLATLPEAKRGNTRNIIRGSTIRVRPQGPASGPLAQASLLLRWSHVDAQHSPASLLAFISGNVLTLGVSRFPAAPKVHHKLLVFAADSFDAGFDYTLAASTT